MKIDRICCPSCSKPLYFPTTYSCGYFRIMCSSCYVRYDLFWLDLNLPKNEFYHSFNKFSFTSYLNKYNGTQHDILIANRNRFFPPYQPDAIVFTKPQSQVLYCSDVKAIYSLDSFRMLQIPLPLIFLSLVVGIIALALLSTNVLAILCLVASASFILWSKTLLRLLKIKPVRCNSLLAEQNSLKQGYEYQLKLNLYGEELLKYQNYLQRLNSLLDKTLQNSELYFQQINLYRRTCQCVENYLALCNRAVERYSTAIEAVMIQVEASKLADSLTFKFTDIHTQLELDNLEDQIRQAIPPQLYESNH